MPRAIPALGATKFTELGDTPSSYSGQAGKLPYVKTTEDGLEFLTQKAVGFSSRARAYLSANQSVPTGAFTKILLNAENYDEQGEFDNVTNYRFTAKKAGYYQVNACAVLNLSVDTARLIAFIYKNGAMVARADSQMSVANTYVSANVSDVIYLAADDYLELYVWHNCGSNRDIYGGSAYTFLSIHKLSE
jgi:hypothetical protein